MLTYDRAFGRMMLIEGYMSDHEADPGGLTVYGISRTHHPEMYVDGNPTLDDARDFYKRVFWNPMRCDQWPPQVANRIFDASVNVGMQRTTRWVQEGCNVFLPTTHTPLAVDGSFGPLTQRAMEWVCKNRAENFTGWLLWRQGHYYAHEMRSDLRTTFGVGLWRRLGIPY